MRTALVGGLVFLSGCMVFDESMRRPKSDAGVTSGSSTASSASSGSGGGTCSFLTEGAGGAGGAMGGCPGKTARPIDGENAPANAQGAVVAIDSARCGEVSSGQTETFSVAVSAGDCLDFAFVSDTASATVSAPGVPEETVMRSGSVGLGITANGSVSIAIAGTGAWRFVVWR